MSKDLVVDYSFELGLYKDQREMKDINNVLYKLQALLNLLAMRPGTNQDNPSMGIDMSNLQFVEGEEIDNVKSDIQNTIRRQASTYIDPSLVEDIQLETVDVPGSNDGSKEITLGIQLKDGVAMAIHGIQSSSGFTINNSVIDSTPFKSVQ